MPWVCVCSGMSNGIRLWVRVSGWAAEELQGATSVTSLGNFWKVLGKQICYLKYPNMNNFLVDFEKYYFKSKNCFGCFLGHFWK